MKRNIMKLCMAAFFVAAISAKAEILIIQAEDAVILGTNYVIMVDTNVPPYAFGTNYIASTTTRGGEVPMGSEIAVYEIGNLTSNAQYDLYLRVHVGPGGYNDDSIFIADGFTTNAFNMVNGIAGATGLDGMVATAVGFHWVKINGNLLGWRGPYAAGAATNLVFSIGPREDGLDVDALAFVSAGLPVTDAMLNPANSGIALWPAGYQPNAPTTDSTPDIQAFFADGAETVDTNSITLFLNGVEITSGVTSSYANATTTVGYTPSSPLEAGAVHTGKVVVASTPSGTLFTNEWTFEILSYPIIYLDAAAANTIMATSTNGPVGDGTELVTSPDSLLDGLWRFRTGFGVAPTVTNGPTGTITLGATNTLFESHDWQTKDNVPRLKTSVSELDDHTYAVYVYFWNAGVAWCVRAGLEDTPGTDSLQLFTATSNNVVQVGIDTAGRTLHRAFIGYVTGTSIDVYIEDLPGVDSNDRVWYDGIGYQRYDGTIGPTLDPDIQYITIAGGNATLTWTSEANGTYSIMHKTNLTDATWTAVKTGIAGGEPTTTDSVTVSGGAQEFFQIKGE